MSNMPHIPSQEELGERIRVALGRGIANQNRINREQELLTQKEKNERQSQLAKIMALLPFKFEHAVQTKEKEIVVCTSQYRNESTINGAFEDAQPSDSGAIEVEYPAYGTWWKKNNGGAFVTLSEESQILWDYMTKLGLQPKIRYNHDGGGMEDWFEMVVPNPTK
jgi:hypothetical protein